MLAIYQTGWSTFLFFLFFKKVGPFFIFLKNGLRRTVFCNFELVSKKRADLSFALMLNVFEMPGCVAYMLMFRVFDKMIYFK